MATHEPVASHRKLARGSDRSFGLLFAAIFAVIGVWPLIFANGVRLWAIGFAAVLFTVAFVAPNSLTLLNSLWQRLGLALHRVINPIVMALLYVGVIVPIGLFLKARRRSPLKLRFDRSAKSYWILREYPAPRRGSMKKQF